MAGHFEPVVDANCQLVAPPPKRRTAIGGYPKVASYDMLGEQLNYSNPVKHGWPLVLAGFAPKVFFIISAISRISEAIFLQKVAGLLYFCYRSWPISLRF